MPWQRGRGTIERLVDDVELERVVPSDDLADRLMDDASANWNPPVQSETSIRPVPTSWRTMPPARPAAPSLPCRACGRRLGEVTSLSKTPSASRSGRFSLRSLGCVDADETASTRTSTRPISPKPTPTRASRRPLRWWTPPLDFSKLANSRRFADTLGGATSLRPETTVSSMSDRGSELLPGHSGELPSRGS